MPEASEKLLFAATVVGPLRETMPVPLGVSVTFWFVPPAFKPSAPLLVIALVVSTTTPTAAAAWNSNEFPLVLTVLELTVTALLREALHRLLEQRDRAPP